jgi:hypothetical protein
MRSCIGLHESRIADHIGCENAGGAAGELVRLHLEPVKQEPLSISVYSRQHGRTGDLGAADLRMAGHGATAEDQLTQLKVASPPDPK